MDKRKRQRLNNSIFNGPLILNQTFSQTEYIIGKSDFARIMHFYESKCLIFVKFFFLSGFLHRYRRFTGQQGNGGDHLLFHSTTSTRSQTLRHLFATLHVRWLSRTFNRNACVYQTATRWDIPTNRITIWVIDWWCTMFVCLFTWWIDTRFLLQRFDIGNRWFWTRIDYHPCIRSEPTNQVC